VVEHGVEQRAQVRAPLLAGRAFGQRRPAVQARGVDHREVELVFGGAELVEQLEGGVDDVVGPRAGLVDLVDHDDGLEAQRQRLLGDEAGLRHRAFLRVDQQHHAVDHRQRALDLAAEVGVPGVSTMLMCVPFQVTAQFLARMVMPRSRSMSLLSITRSATFSFSRKVPLWRSSWSTSVVLPWSTWAMMAMLRIWWLMSGFLDFDGAQQAVGDQFACGDVGGAEKGARVGGLGRAA
jgi:hypothetical protein